MKKSHRFGSSTRRTDSGALLSGEIEGIKGFLRFRGLLVARFFECQLVLCFPSVVDEVKEWLVEKGFQEVIIGATLDGLRQVIELSVLETRVLEVLSPGPVIIVKEDRETSKTIAITIPDDLDLRDIASALGGAMTAFMRPDGNGRDLPEDAVYSLHSSEDHTSLRFGSLESNRIGQSMRTRATVVRITGPCEFECLSEGMPALARIEEAASRLSHWEIEDWT